LEPPVPERTKLYFGNDDALSGKTKTSTVTGLPLYLPKDKIQRWPDLSTVMPLV